MSTLHVSSTLPAEFYVVARVAGYGHRVLRLLRRARPSCRPANLTPTSSHPPRVPAPSTPAAAIAPSASASRTMSAPRLSGNSLGVHRGTTEENAVYAYNGIRVGVKKKGKDILS